MKKLISAFIKNFSWSICILILILSCQSENPGSPRPRLYPKVEYPTKTYTKFKESYCELQFDYPAYAEIVKESNFFDETPKSSCWFNIIIPKLNGTIYCSYYDIQDQQSLDDLIQDAFTLVGKHNIKANYRTETKIQRNSNVSGIWFEIEGPVATPYQFYLTDSTKHFFRASLYFNNEVATDSMAPIYEFVKLDMLKMIESFEWSK